MGSVYVALHTGKRQVAGPNQAEIEISLFSRPCLELGRILLLRDPNHGAQAWSRRMNRNHVVINWKFTRQKVHQKFG
jgi:hypothetical protein